MALDTNTINRIADLKARLAQTATEPDGTVRYLTAEGTPARAVLTQALVDAEAHLSAHEAEQKRQHEALTAVGLSAAR